MNKADICVGDYVRTKQGYIARIERIDNDFIDCDSSVYSNYGEESPLLPINMKLLDGTHLRAIDYITKHSKNIIDLIEVGDILTYEHPALKKTYLERIDTEGHLQILKEFFKEKSMIIKSVVTHEMFSSMQYIVKED